MGHEAAVNLAHGLEQVFAGYGRGPADNGLGAAAAGWTAVRTFFRVV
jgi:hypothetical protein